MLVFGARGGRAATIVAATPPSAFFIIGFLIWGVRSWKPDQVEEAEYQIHQVHRTEVV